MSTFSVPLRVARARTKPGNAVDLPNFKDQVRSKAPAQGVVSRKATANNVARNANPRAVQGEAPVAAPKNRLKSSETPRLPSFKDQIRSNSACSPPRRVFQAADEEVNPPIAPIVEPVAVMIMDETDEPAPKRTKDVKKKKSPPRDTATALTTESGNSPARQAQVTVRRNFIWACALVFVAVIVAGVVVAIVISTGAGDSSDSSIVDPSENPAPGPNIPTSYEVKLVASNIIADDYLGQSVAISGETILVGAYFDVVDDAGTNSGSAFVFERSGGTWAEQAKLTPSDAATYDYFAWSIAISKTTVAVGARRDDDDGENSGSVYIFERSGSNWIQQAKLTSNDPAVDDWFGFSVAVDEAVVVVGVLQDDDNGFNSGSAYIYARSGTSWTLQAKLVPPDGAAEDKFGRTVAVSASTVAVGAYWDDKAGSNSGSVYVYVRSSGSVTGAVWSQQAKLTPNDASSNDEFGWSVSLYGNTLVVGARFDNDNGDDSGSAYVFTREDDMWTEQAKLIASDGAEGDYFGASVSIAGDNILVGAWGKDTSGGGDALGCAYLYTRSGSTWTEKAKITASDGAAEDRFGFAVAVSETTAVVGSYLNDSNGKDSGAAYAFDLTQL